MIVSAIADPSIFGPDCITDELTSREVVGFLRGILQNGVLLSDPSRQLVRDAMTEANALLKVPGGTQRGQRISLILQEIYKQHKKYIVSCEVAKWNATNPSTVLNQIIVLHAHLKADVVVAPVDRHPDLKRAWRTPSRLSLRRKSRLATTKACEFVLPPRDKPLDEMSQVEVEEYIGRSVKYCSVLRLYDYRMVARPRSISKFREGIQFVLAIWMSGASSETHRRARQNCTRSGSTQTQDGFLTGAEAKARLVDDIVAPVTAAGSCHSTGYVVEDSRRIFHARGFEAKKRAFTIDPGFDALGIGGPVRRCLLKAEVAAEEHFEQCRRLRNV